MSGIDVATKYGTGIGEVKLESAGEVKPYQSSLATIIASEVVSDIIDNALDIAIGKSDLSWDKKCTITMDDELNIRHKLEGLDFKSAGLDEASLSPNIKQLIEGLNTISVNNQNPDKTSEEPLQLDMEMKRLLTEMMSPPYPIVNYSMQPRKDGVGDQPLQPTMEEELMYLGTRSEDIMVDSDQVRIVEKKSRVTDLVMNKRKVLSELLMDETAKKANEEWEETNEAVMSVIDLECVQPGEIAFSCEEKPKVCKTYDNYNILPEDIPLPPEDDEFAYTRNYDEGKRDEDNKEIYGGKEEEEERDDEDELYSPPNEDVMEIIDLSNDTLEGEEVCSGSNREKVSPGSFGGKGDVTEMIGDQAKTEFTIEEVKDGEKFSKKDSGKKKKWNLGSRFFGFLKKRQKNKANCCTTS